MITTYQFIRQRLIEAGDKGCCSADLHKERKARHKELGIIYKGGIYHSFNKLFSFLRKLGWIEATGKEEISHSKGNSHSLKGSRKYYRITKEGLAHSEAEWSNPILILHPKQ